MERIYIALLISLLCITATAQNVGINTTTPQASLDIKGNHRVGGADKFMLYDSASGRIGWTNSHLFVPVPQYLIKHSASSEGLYYENAQIQYRNQDGNPVFFTDWNNGHGYFSNRLGVGTTMPSEKLDVAGNINLTGQLKFNNNSGSANQVLTSTGAASAPSWKNSNKYVFAEDGTSIILNGGFQSMPIVDGQIFTLDFPAIVKVTVSVVGTVNAGETIVQEPRFFFRIRQGATIITSGAEGYSYIKPQPATYVSNTMSVTKYFPGLSPGTYSLECKATTLSSGGTCYLSSSQAMIEIIPQ